MRASILAIIILISINGNAQTKKIANATSNASGPNFNWAGSDNLGEIMNYEEIVEFHYQYDSILNQSLAIDTCTAVDSIVNDSLVTVYEDIILCDTVMDKDSTMVRKVKYQQGSSDKKLKKVKKQNKKGVREEIQLSRKELNGSDRAWKPKGLFMLLLIPVGYLMTKKRQKQNDIH